MVTFIHSSPKLHQLLIKQWSSRQSGSNNERKGPDSVLFTLLSHSRGIHNLSRSLSLVAAGCPAVALARMYLVLFPAECRVHRGYALYVDQTSDS